MPTAYIFLLISKDGTLEGADIFSDPNPCLGLDLSRRAVIYSKHHAHTFHEAFEAAKDHAARMGDKIGGLFGEVLRSAAMTRLQAHRRGR